MRIATRRGLREARQMQIISEEFGVDDLNPRSHLVRDMRKGIERSEALDKAFAAWLSLCDGDVGKARSTTPYVPPSSFPEYADIKAADDAFKTMDAVLPRWRDNWPWVFDHWYSGAMHRSTEDLRLNLPQSVR